MSFLSLGTRGLSGKHPFKGDCRNNEDVDKCFCLEEIDDRQLKLVLLRLLFSLSLSYGNKHRGSCCTTFTLRASGKTQLKAEPANFRDQSTT